MISVINSAYTKYNGKNISDEELINYISSIKDNMSKEAYGLFVRDYNENNFLIVKDIKDYLKNEHLYDNYLDEEPYIGLKNAGLKLVEDGYFDIANNFPRKITLADLKDDNLKELISSKYKSRYKFLLNEEQTYERMGELDTVENIKKFSKYLVKATRLRLKKDLINNVDFKETMSNFPHNDLDSLIKAIKVYKEGKGPEEWLTLSISLDDEYVVKLSLINNNSKDTNIFKYDKNDKFLTESLSNIINTFLENDMIVNVNGDSTISTFITENGNRIVGSSVLLKDLEKDNSDYIEYEKLVKEEENNTITPFGIARKKELAQKDENIGKLDKLNQEFNDNTVTEEEYKKQKNSVMFYFCVGFFN
jgi:hypothetical protein